MKQRLEPQDLEGLTEEQRSRGRELWGGAYRRLLCKAFYIYRHLR